MARYGKGEVDGIGIVLGRELGMVGIDLDHCRNSATGEITSWAESIVQRIDSYTEVSPSGEGLRILCKANWPDHGRKRGMVEAYSEGRYLTMTGAHVQGTPGELEARDKVIQAWYAETFNTGEERAKRLSVPSDACEICSPTFVEKFPHESFIIDPHASPPFDKFNALLEVNVKFKLSWQHKRKDFMERGDDSASVYDLSLAAFVVQAGWMLQEIVDLLIAHRRNYGEPIKEHEYFVRTCVAARISVGLQAAESGMEEYLLSRAAQDGQPGDIGPSQREQLLEDLSCLYHVPFRRVVKYRQTPALYKFIVGGKGDAAEEVVIGKIGALRTQKVVLDALAEATGISHMPVKAVIWNKRVQIMLDVAEEVDVGSDATERGHSELMLTHYFESHMPEPLAENADLWIFKKPFIEEGRVHVFGEAWRRWIARVHGDKVSPQEIGRWLRECGGEPYQKAVTKPEGGRTTRLVWKLSPAWTQAVLGDRGNVP